ncbi:MAG TPA: selenocysteine-specific translation elongation factor [Acidothermaceae bacterium]
MHVIATAGHVDHGKSTLVRALTGMEPDRWAEERRRGMTIDLGFAWTEVDGSTLAFVDVPGHERFVTNMLAGVGPVPAVLVVVAADEGWMPQTQEHVAALDALGVRHGLLAVTRCDLADPSAAIADARQRLARTTLGQVEAIPVAIPPNGPSTGLDELRTALALMVSALPAPDPTAPVRLWIDRSFSIRGSGTVVTGTLAAGAIAVQDTLVLASSDGSAREVTVRGLQSLKRPERRVSAVARVAINLRGVDKDDARRGDALLTPGAWSLTDVVDVAISGGSADELAQALKLHAGAAAIPARIRPLGDNAARLRLAGSLPLRVGDVALLRDPARHRIAASARVLDVDPPRLRGRGAAAGRGRELAELSSEDEERAARARLRQRGIVQGAALRNAGVGALPRPFTGDWLVDDQRAAALRASLRTFVATHARTFPLEPGPTVDAARRALDLPDRALVLALVETSDDAFAVRDGRIVERARGNSLPPPVAAAVERVRSRLASEPFAAPETAELAALGLGPPELAAAERAGLLLRVSPSVVLRPDAPEVAARRLAGLPQPFTVGQAREALGTTRRVAVPLLEFMDRSKLTRRLADDTRTVVEPNQR